MGYIFLATLMTSPFRFAAGISISDAWQIVYCKSSCISRCFSSTITIQAAIQVLLLLCAVPIFALTSHILSLYRNTSRIFTIIMITTTFVSNPNFDRFLRE